MKHKRGPIEEQLHRATIRRRARARRGLPLGTACAVEGCTLPVGPAKTPEAVVGILCWDHILDWHRELAAELGGRLIAARHDEQWNVEVVFSVAIPASDLA